MGFKPVSTILFYKAFTVNRNIIFIHFIILFMILKVESNNLLKKMSIKLYFSADLLVSLYWYHYKGDLL